MRAATVLSCHNTLHFQDLRLSSGQQATSRGRGEEGVWDATNGRVRGAPSLPTRAKRRYRSRTVETRYIAALTSTSMPVPD